MLTETKHQPLLDEAKQWIEHLATYGESINEMKGKFYKWAAGKTDHDVLVQIEHFHNQFHIQLINLHDLKHSMRQYMKQLNLIPELDYSMLHQKLDDQYKFLIHELDQLKADFKAFVS
jgi:hypothetical protein